MFRFESNQFLEGNSNCMKLSVKKLLGNRICVLGGRIVRAYRAIRFFLYDYLRFVKYSGCVNTTTREAMRARVIMTYHVVEKGLTMPNRRLAFGKAVIRELMHRIQAFINIYGVDDDQIKHGIGVIKEYFKLHIDSKFDTLADDSVFWNEIKVFISKYPDVKPSSQFHFNASEFYRDVNAAFPVFAFARHTLRHYAEKDLPVERIRKAVEIAMSTPSACNRQHCRVHCVSDKDICQKLLALQGGNRGFGQYADKLLLVTTDLEDIISAGERLDAFTNGGMFLMNLCYALFYQRIAHCILNWSRQPCEDMKMRKLVPGIKPSESVVAVLSCGETPDEFDVACSPRKNVSEVFFV